MQKQEREAYQEWENHAHIVLNKYLRLMRDYAEIYAPKSPDDVPDDRFVYSQFHLKYAEYIAEKFLSADKDEKSAMKKEIEKIEREYENIREK